MHFVQFILSDSLRLDLRFSSVLYLFWGLANGARHGRNVQSDRGKFFEVQEVVEWVRHVFVIV